MRIRLASAGDLENVLLIYQGARDYMVQHGNAGQWAGNYPPRALVANDIEKKQCYVCEEEGRLFAVFALIPGEDPAYRVIDGAWKNARPYAALHRMASTGERRGMTDLAIKWAFERWGNLRGDTHELNKAMRRAFERNGFERCGTVWVQDGTPRIAYQKER